ncbi:amidase [Brevibacterium sp. ZH18]|uniref:amidase n=1 Tax=Brevibacterium sp. ZH18 TaxID=2927784 RepID=UPI001F60C13C|nr:amidase [Brevibacterium sp. ZH18]
MAEKDQAVSARDQAVSVGTEAVSAGDLIRAYPDLTAQIAAVRAGEVSASELLQDSLALADAVGEKAGVFLQRFDDSASDAARRVDRALADAGAEDALETVPLAPAPLPFAGTSLPLAPTTLPRAGKSLPLAGVPLGIKPMIAAAEAPTTAQSAVFDPSFYEGRDSVVVDRLRAAGAVVEGTTTMAEHAAGRPDPALGFPLPRNPWDLSRWPGGSSCGTAIGISLGIFAGGLGTDTSGSCRIPAAYCGITGMRPTRGSVPTGGVLNASPTLDVVGPMARSARDCRLLLEVMQGRAAGRGGEQDNSSEVAAPSKQHTANPGSEQATRRIGVPKQVVESDRIGSAVNTAFSQALVDLSASGFDIDYVDLPFLDELIAATMIIMIREMYEVHEESLPTRWTDYGRSFRRLAVMGCVISDDIYHRALGAADHLGALLDEVLQNVDALVLPTWPEPAPPYVFKGGTPQEEWNLTAAFCAVPHPSLALPMGFDDAGLPLSLQVVGPYSPDDPDRGNTVILNIGEAFQALTDHHRRFAHIDAEAVVSPVPDPDDSASGDSAPGDSAPGESAPGNSAPGNSAPDEGSPDDRDIARSAVLFDQLPEPLRRLGIPFDEADSTTLLALARLFTTMT